MKDEGALLISSYATHGICSGTDFYTNLKNSDLNRLYLSDSLPSKNPDEELKSKIKRVSLEEMIVDAIHKYDDTF